MDAEEPEVGQRIIYQGFKATILYVGKVNGSPHVC